MYRIEVVTPPSSEPVAVSDVKTALRLNTTAEDSLIAGYISTARQVFEARTQLCLMPTTLRQWVGQFGPAHAVGWGRYERIVPGPVHLARGPVQSVSDVKYYDPADTLQTLTGWTADTAANPCPVYLQGGNYPAFNVNRAYPAYVDFVAGYADATAVPAAIKTAIFLYACHLYANREAVSDKALAELPFGFKAVCDLYKISLEGTWGM